MGSSERLASGNLRKKLVIEAAFVDETPTALWEQTYVLLAAKGVFCGFNDGQYAVEESSFENFISSLGKAS